MTTGEIIQSKRKQKGWSQDQLAERLNISRQSVSKWEQDLALPDLENGLKLCETLGITVEELLHPKETEVTPINPTSENAFQSAEKFVKKKWHFAGLIVASAGLCMAIGATLFKSITQAMNDQAQAQWGGMFGGMFPTIQTGSVLNPFINIIVTIGIAVMLVGLGIYAYGRYRKQTT
jgi:transcriptional regulator with XRE-family HTH domain